MAMPVLKFQYPRVLSIAGSDSSGGAGIQADLKTLSALGCYGMTAITALTAQNTCGVRSIHGVPTQVLRDQIDAVLQDAEVDAVKIGMLYCAEIANTVAQAIDRYALKNVVLDPVMIASSGATLMDQNAVSVLVRELFPRVTVVTPNLDEAARLVGRSVTSTSDMEQAARALQTQGARAVVLKGGHLAGNDVIDLLLTADGEALWMSAPRIHSTNTHGTGCTLSSAIAAYLALGMSLPDAVQQARDYVRAALLAGAQVHTGQCGGPLNHGHAPIAMHLKGWPESTAN